VIATVRRFNRAYTQRIGALDDSFLGSGRSLGAARVLFEVGPHGASVLDLRHRLGLDSGYLSRLLRQLEGDRLVTVAADPGDRRRRVAQLTARGRTAWNRLDRRSDEVAQALVTGLSPRQQRQLADALGRADRLIRLATLRFDVVAASHPDAVWAMTEYFAELDRRFPSGFDPGAALTADVEAYSTDAGGAFVLARSDGDVVGCGAVMRLDRRTAEIKRMWVHTEWRSGGVGRRVLATLERLAGDRGYRRVVLDTNSTLTEAIAMYERSGYRPIERYNDNPYACHWFEKPLARRGSGTPADAGVPDCDQPTALAALSIPEP
jgi:DNA-binding MarR family transcriptional regulator/GNAT superfamily N-acetyltransferase